MFNYNNNKWNNLTIKQKSDLIKIYVKHGMYDLNQMKEHYNNFEPTKTDTKDGYIDNYSNGGNLFGGGSQMNITNASTPSDWDMQMAGFIKPKSGLGDYFDRYTPDQYQQYYKQQQAKETYNKQQAQKLIKESKRVNAQQTKQAMLESGRFTELPDGTIKQSTGEKPLEQSNIDFDLLLALATAGTGNVAKNSIKGLAKGINKFNKTPLGRMASGYGTYDGIKNLITDNGIKRLYRKQKKVML